MKRPYSTKFTARGVPRRYLLSGIPPTLWERVRAQAKREHISMRSLILMLLDGWIDDARVRQREATQAAMRRAVARSAEIDAEYEKVKPGGPRDTRPTS